MIAGMPSRRAAIATPRAWFPEEKATTPVSAPQRKLEQAVGRAPQLERAAGLQTFAFEPDADPATSLSISGCARQPGDPLGRFDDIVASDLSQLKLLNSIISPNRFSGDKLCQMLTERTKKSCVGDPQTYIAPRCPMGLPTARQLWLELPRWRSLELHKHHRALGLANAQSGTRGGADIAAAPGPAGHAAASARRAARRAFLRREVSGPVALCGQGQSLARPAAHPVGRRRHALRRRLDRRSAVGLRRRCPRRSCASCTRSRPKKPSPRPISSMA